MSKTTIRRVKFYLKDHKVFTNLRGAIQQDYEHDTSMLDDAIYREYAKAPYIFDAEKSLLDYYGVKAMYTYDEPRSAGGVYYCIASEFSPGKVPGHPNLSSAFLACGIVDARMCPWVDALFGYTVGEVTSSGFRRLRDEVAMVSGLLGIGITPPGDGHWIYSDGSTLYLNSGIAGAMGKAATDVIKNTWPNACRMIMPFYGDFQVTL